MTVTIARPLLVEQVLIAALMLIIVPVTLAQPSQEDLAKAAQNPIASMISVPIQSNNDFDWGPEGKLYSVNNVQPVIPFDLNDDWNLVTRTILPIMPGWNYIVRMYQPGPEILNGTWTFPSPQEAQ